MLLAGVRLSSPFSLKAGFGLRYAAPDSRNLAKNSFNAWLHTIQQLVLVIMPGILSRNVLILIVFPYSRVHRLDRGMSHQLVSNRAWVGATN